MLTRTKRIYQLLLYITICLHSCQPIENNTSDLTSASAKLLLAEKDLPEYEANIDHAGFMKTWTKEFFHKGMITYRNVCYNCHGNEEQPGSMPNSMKFWADEFKHGNDPYAMYETLTRGFGMMAPQVNLSPQEKYEVIHFIREEYIKQYNPDQYFEVDDAYLENLPKGESKGPTPKKYQPWAEMDYGDFWIRTYELADSTHPEREISGGRSPLANENYKDYNFAYKGIAIRLDEGEGGVAAGNTFALFDHDLLRFTGFWTGEGFIDYRNILMNDEHNIYPRTIGKIQVENPITPGWANPKTNAFKDPRLIAPDGRPFGPLPREWAHYKGLYYHGQKVILKYTVADATVLEMYQLEKEGDKPIISRTLNVTAPSQALTLRIAPAIAAVGVKGNVDLAKADGFHIITIPKGKSTNFKLLLSAADQASVDDFSAFAKSPEDLNQYTKGGPAHYVNTVLESPIIKGDQDEAYAVDVFTLPQNNPWNSRMRPSGIEFIKGGEEALVCTIDGEVYRLEGITQSEGNVKWHRIATGLFEPLGIKYKDGNIYVGCRDQIVKLHDLNGDGETDFYESFNSDHQVTEHFHEFAMGLQTDAAGNFYYAKSGRHARRSLVPQHGTLLKVSPDGLKTTILANGFRAANGVCLNPDGSFFVTDQEGYWNPMNRINRVTTGGFYGNMYGFNPPADSTDEGMIQPLFWVDSKYDRSPAELLWVDSDRWGPLNGALLNLSYGYGKIYIVMPQQFDDVYQAGMIELNVPQFPTGLMRARFNPKDGQFYGCGMSAWATSQMIQVGGLYRVRYTGKPLNMPVEMSAFEGGMQLTFSDELDLAKAEAIKSYTINTWDLKRSRRYGSKRLNTKELVVDKVTVSNDRKTVFLHLPNIEPTWVMEVLYELESSAGKPMEGAVQSTIYGLEEKAS